MDLQSSSAVSIVADSSATLASIQTFALSSDSYTNQTVTFYSSTPKKYTSDVYFQTTTQTLSITESWYKEVTINLPCSSTGSTSISYSIESYNNTQTPSFVTLNSTTGSLIISAPSVNSSTSYWFYVNSNFTGVFYSVQKLIQLTIAKCSASNCQKCSETDGSVCVKCSSGYQPSSGSCSYIEATYVAKSMSITTTSATATATVMGTAASIFNFASAVSLWSMINQMQLFFFLLMTGQYIPKDVEIVIVGNKFCVYPFDFFQFKSFTVTNYITEYFDFATSDTTLELAGISSGSSIVNVYSVSITFAMFVVLHIVISILIKIQIHLCAKLQDKKVFRIIKLIIYKLFVYLSFGFYLRLCMETNQYMLMSSISEMHQFNNFNLSRILSFIFSLCLLVICANFIIFVCYFALYFENLKFKKLNMFGELFNGIKDNLKSRLYVVALLLRRAVFVLLLILLSSVSPKFVISFLSGVQCVYCILIVLIRPYELAMANFIEIINEVYFACLFGSLFFFDLEDKWSNGVTSAFVVVLFSCTFINFLVIMSKEILHNILVDLFAKLFHKFCGTKKVSSPVILPNEMQHPPEVNKINQSGKCLNSSSSLNDLDNMPRNVSKATNFSQYQVEETKLSQVQAFGHRIHKF